MSVKAPPTLEGVYAEAKADLSRGGVEVALKWAFKHARAVARAARAEQAARYHDQDRYRLQLDMSSSFPTAPGAPADKETAYDIVTAALHAAAADLADAKAIEVACEHVWQLAARTPKQAPAATPAARPRAA